MQRLGISLNDDFSFEENIQCVRFAEKIGYDSVWVPEDYYISDAISRMTMVASETKRIKLAAGVINPHSRSPPLIAMTFASLDKLSNKRVILGLGPGLRQWLYEPYRGHPNHLLVIKECVDIFRALISGKKVSYDGKVFKIQNVQLGSKPVRESIPVYLGAMGPKMLQLAGEIADGVLLTACATPEYVKYAVENVRIGAERARRDFKEIDVASLIPFSVADDPEEARAATKSFIAYIVALQRFNAVLEKSNLQDNKSLTPIREAVRNGDLERATQYVDDELTEALTISGVPKECKQKLKRFTSAGVKLPVLVPYGRIEAIKKAIKAVS